jgi:seryl-tRNA synthetase
MTPQTALFIKELMQVTSSDILLLTLVTFFFLSGLTYKIKATRDVWNTRASIRKLKGNVQESADQERRFKTELQELMQAQNANMAEINRMRRKKADASHYPATLQKELDELISWCRQRNIAVDFERRMATRRPRRKK